MARNRLLLPIDLLNKSRWSGHAIWQITGDALGADLARTPTTPDPRESNVLTERQIALKRPSGVTRERRIPLLLVLRAEGACGSTRTEWLGYPSELGWALQRCPNPPSDSKVALLAGIERPLRIRTRKTSSKRPRSESPRGKLRLDFTLGPEKQQLTISDRPLRHPPAPDRPSLVRCRGSLPGRPARAGGARRDGRSPRGGGKAPP